MTAHPARSLQGKNKAPPPKKKKEARKQKTPIGKRPAARGGPSPKEVQKEPPPKVNWSGIKQFTTAMLRDVGVVLLEGMGDRENINLYDFLKPHHPDLDPDLSRFTLEDFFRSPHRRIPDRAQREAIQRHIPHLMKQLREDILKTIRYLGKHGIWRLEGLLWWKPRTPLKPIPQRILDDAIYWAYRLPSNAPPPRSEKHRILGHRRPPPPPSKKVWTMRSRLRDILKERCKTWEDVSLAEFLLEECAFRFEDQPRPKGSLHDFLQDPAQYLHHEEARERVLQEMPAKLEDLKGRVLRDGAFLHEKGLKVLGQWLDCLRLGESLTYATTRILNGVVNQIFDKPYEDTRE
ncbi:unnamed protein product [Trypanosoma congolense IL3000]|uniref:WGS project CAEQ00000000 data, annotated contig 2443 n=1 Tax=Trypanosoma congolense (strain IL3000) TaxID=1068625 RepID=F9WE65_TRYCI|nr:unnamed protein product [Trypanosoma congolense IL3000]